MILLIYLTLLGFRSCVGFSLAAVSGGYSLVSVCGLLIPVASFAVEHRLWVHGLQQLCYEGFDAPWHVESFQSRDRPQIPCTGKWILNHYTTGEAHR